MIIDSPIISGSSVTSGSFNQFGNVAITGSLTVTGGITGSVTNAVSASYAATASFALNVPETASYATTAANAQNSDLLDNKNSTEFAVTSSNIFTGQQRITNTTNPTSFTDVASLYTDGGLRVTKDTYISGSAFIAGNFTVFGTSSIEYVTSSTFIGLEYIDLNTDLPALRYAGIRVYDSGSPSESTSSLLWDSQNNKWIYSNPSTVGYSGGMLISGPRNTGSLGNEQGTTNNVIVKGQGGDHITSSQIIDDGTTVSIPGNLTVTGSIIGSLTGTATSASYWSGSIINAESASYWSGSVVNAQSASFASTASFWSGSITNALSSSFASTASFALNVPETASFALTASYWSGSVANVLSSSYALTASYATNAGAGAGFPFSGSAIITGSLQVTNLTGSGTAYLVADSTGSILRQNASAALRNTQAFTSSAGQTSFSVTNGYTTGYVDVFINGTKLSAGEFTDTSGTNIVLTTGSFDGDIVEVVKYLPAEGVSTNVLRTQTNFIATAGQTVFSASYAPGLLDIFYNGSKLSYTEYTANNGTYFTLATASNAGDVLDVFNYSYQIGGFSGIGGNGAISQIPYFATTHSITGSPNLTFNGSTLAVTGGFAVFTGSAAEFQVNATGVRLGNAITDSHTVTGSLSMSGSFSTVGTITAQTLVVQTITSSTDFVTGSTRFGSILGNTHVFSGSVTMNPGGLFVSSSGNVGIGLTNPSNKLEVQAGDIKINAGASRYANLYFGITGTNYGKIQYYDIDGSMFITTIGAGSGYDLNLGTKENVRLTILGSNGNVGINTTSPANLLHLAGASATPSLRLGSVSTGFHWDIGRENATTGDFVFNNANGGSTSERLRITVGGNVGIGTITPNNLLSVRGNVDFGATGLAYAGPSQYGGVMFPRGQILFSNTNSQNQFYISSNAYTNASGVFAYRNSSQPATAIGLDNGGMAFLVAGNGTADATISWTSALGVTNSGNVLIGDTSNASGAPTFYVKNKNGAVANIAGWNFGGTTTAENGNNCLLTAGAYYNGSSLVATQTTATNYQQYSGTHVWYTNSGLTAGNTFSNTERMRINSGGGVRIGSTTAFNDDIKFNVYGTGVWNGANIGLQNGGTGGKDWIIFSTMNDFGQGGGNLLFYNNSGPSNNALIIYANGNYDFGGSDVSDVRLKQDIENLNHGLNDIMLLSPKSYYLKSEDNLQEENQTTLRKRYGFIAQEVQQILPDTITGEETETDYLGLDYNGVLAVAVKAIQEQQTLITSLQTRIEQLENK